MIVFGRRFQFKLLAVMITGQVALFDQVGFLEQVEGPIDRGKIDVGITAPRATIQFLCVEMFLTLLNDLQEQGALPRNAFAHRAERTFRLAQYLGVGDGFGVLMLIANHLQ